MIKNNTRKVYIVNNFKSDKIEQAIFILKTNSNLSGKEYGELALEAQKIIDDYVIKIEKEKRNTKRREKSYFTTLFAILTIIATFGALTYFTMFFITKLW